jgi:hypothetical protein
MLVVKNAHRQICVIYIFFMRIIFQLENIWIEK